ncbi:MULTISPECIES: stage V sporulation T C-terminal domain-containing protein [unclassified Candidatus Frackibacter]|nr:MULTISPECIES: stage V sporulation T C-terminal domain-containing protein [unclassified Candidatus Frackibacter]SDC81023.1 AbrB family transcriptional regulator, stage V sporulation protein T [Candidatus Frackibacter sp. WG11]SFM02448.1 AbrB family transcriptional regulator, stage V sporulation protein T [Candidatus Frackibacter sp. WG13]
MKATGIVRKIDNLGRVVIPKEIRKEMKINNGNTLEIFVDQDDSVILKKYSPVEELDRVEDYIDTLVETTDCDVMITDADKVVASSEDMECYVKKPVGHGVKEAMQSRTTKTIKTAKEEDICEECGKQEKCQLESVLIAPIIKQGDVLGSVILSTTGRELGDYEGKVAETTAKIFSKQLGL